MPIRVLDPQVASKIAAGEVVERPASVVKELLENAVDAGATVVHVETRNGGLDLIRVTDNGCGIPGDEMALAFEHHATSKIAGLDDLQAVRTLGFRGEALYSIAAVAQVSLVSRTAADAAGSYIEVADGHVLARGVRGASQGTTVSARNLFFNVPARRKFLRSPEIEGGRITALVSQFALAYPGLHFFLTSNARLVFQSTGSGSLFDALINVFGLETARQMIEVSSASPDPGKMVPDEGLSLEPTPANPVQGRRDAGAGPVTGVSGYVSQPSVNRATRAYLSLFVNHRWVQSPMLGRAVEDAYHTMLPIGRHPIAVLNISVPPEQLDVNVHPAKAEVKFLHDREVFSAVQRAVRSALAGGAIIPEFAASGGAAERPTLPAGLAHSFLAPGRLGPEDSARAQAVFRPAKDGAEAGPGGAAETSGGLEGSRLPPLRIVGQLAQTYIVSEAPDGLYLIDQHTAHERILYERLMAEHARLSVDSQMLLEPLALELTPRQEALLRPRLDALAEMGFRVEPFGEKAYLVRAVPAVLRGADAGQALLEIVDLLADEKAVPGAWREQLCITLACHGAVKAGLTLTLDEMRQLVTQLERTTLPRTCPHGRPTLLHISQAQLEREFGRR